MSCRFSFWYTILKKKVLFPLHKMHYRVWTKLRWLRSTKLSQTNLFFLFFFLLWISLGLYFSKVNLICFENTGPLYISLNYVFWIFYSYLCLKKVHIFHNFGYVEINASFSFFVILKKTNHFAKVCCRLTDRLHNTSTM